MTEAQIIRKAKAKIRKMISPNEILSIEFTGVDFAKVVMPSTCESEAVMVWNFYISYEPSNEDIFTKLEKHEFPNLITKESLTVTLIK